MYEFTLKHLIENSGIVPNSNYNLSWRSRYEHHFGVLWRLEVVSVAHVFVVFLVSESQRNDRNPWNIEVNFEIRLGSLTLIPELSKPRRIESRLYMENRYIDGDYENIVRNHMIDNSALIECHATITGMSGIVPKGNISFEAPKQNLTDVVLMVGDVKFNVSKVLLGTFSPYFEILFFGNFAEAKKEVIELKEVDPEVFQNLLDIIHGESAIQIENVESLLQLANQMDVAVVRKKCERFLMRSNGVDKQLALRLSEKYNLEELKTKSNSLTGPAQKARPN